MNVFIISYDLNGHVPTHAQMDKRIQSICAEYARVLETVWYIRSVQTAEQVYNWVNAVLSANDRLLVVEASRAVFRNLLVSNAALATSWAKAA